MNIFKRKTNQQIVDEVISELPSQTKTMSDYKYGKTLSDTIRERVEYKVYKASEDARLGRAIKEVLDLERVKTLKINGIQIKRISK